ncbi:MAG: CopD family protein [Roseiflexaceae bacterium]
MRRYSTSIIVTALLALLLAAPVAAHANLVRSEPQAGALLQTAPKEIILEFSEELDPSFSRVQLHASKNQIVNAGPGVIDPANPRIMRLALGDLPKDSYTAIWRSRSAADGHITEGSVPFGVGVAVSTASLIPAPDAPDPATIPPAPLDAAVRWLNVLLAAFALGGLPFGLLIWRPALRKAMADAQERLADASGQRSVPSGWVAADAAMTRALQRMILIGGGLLLVSTILFLLTQAAAAADVPLAQAIGAPAVQLLGSRTGRLILARMVLIVLLGALAWRLPPAGRGAAWPWLVGLALAGGVILTFSLNAHGAAEEQGAALAVALDWLHVTAMVIWLGGLTPLLIAIRAPRRNPDVDSGAPGQALPLAALIPRFSWVALPCVVTLALTGLYSYLLHIGSLDLLAATTYGRALLIKLSLFGLLFLLGALNLLVLTPRLRASGNRMARAFGRSVRTEVVLGALLLLAVGAMTSVAPSKSAWQEHERLGLAQEATVGEVDLVLRVAPAQIGDNEFAVDVTDKRPGAQEAASKVLLRFDMQGMTSGVLQTDTQTADKQRYTARGNFTSMGGRWDVEVVLRRAGFDDVRHTFQMDIVRSALQAQ